MLCCTSFIMTLHLLLFKWCLKSWKIPPNTWAIYRLMLLKLFQLKYLQQQKGWTHALSRLPYSLVVKCPGWSLFESTSSSRSHVLAKTFTYVLHSCFDSGSVSHSCIGMATGQASTHWAIRSALDHPVWALRSHLWPSVIDLFTFYLEQCK